ncbi:MAG TPA: long-chain fatty acid--CoA ligase [Verrucomicrobiae bacterium]
MVSEIQKFIHQSLDGRTEFLEREFNRLALKLFASQFESVPIYRRFSETRKVNPGDVRNWSQIPALPTAAFKEFEVSSIPAAERTDVFYSSGTTQENRSRHFHHAQSLAIYEASLLSSFERNFQPVPGMRMIFLTPKDAPNSSLVHMFNVVSQRFAERASIFLGQVNTEGAWSIDLDRALSELEGPHPVGVLGTAFSFVHLLDHLNEVGIRISLPPSSRVMETGGYKGRSREVPKPELHAMISKFLGVSKSNIVTEYGMSELSSQAYDREGVFHFPPWARARVISPETGAEVGERETGLLQVFDLANIWSVMAVQTEDLAVRRGAGFELLGRAAKSEPRGCSLMPE